MTLVKPKVSILCLAYNHQNYIAQALDGFLLQKTDFPFQVLVGDDASKDSTAEIVQSYATLYPDIIKPFIHKSNIGAARNLQSLVAQVDSEYVALCDGDDFWTDSLKLQKQISFLDSNQDYTVCFHKVIQHFEDNSEEDSQIDANLLLPDVACCRDYFTLDDLLRLNVIASLSVVYRWRLGTKLPPFMLDFSICDLPLHLIHADGGRIHYINDVMGTYRRHKNGAWWNNHTVEHRKENLKNYIKLLQSIYKYLDHRYSRSFEHTIRLCENEWQDLDQNSSVMPWKKYLRRILKRVTNI